MRPVLVTQHQPWILLHRFPVTVRENVLEHQYGHRSKLVPGDVAILILVRLELQVMDIIVGQAQAQAMKRPPELLLNHNIILHIASGWGGVMFREVLSTKSSSNELVGVIILTILEP